MGNPSLRLSEVLSDWNSYKKLRNKVNNQKKQAKEIFFNNLELSITDFHKNDKRKFWQVVTSHISNNNPFVLHYIANDQQTFDADYYYFTKLPTF